MLKNLDNIPWDKITHAYGLATDVPNLIKSLTSNDKETRDNAYWKLYGNVYHKGTQWQASEYVMPFLFELLEHPEVCDKVSLIEYIIDLAIGNPSKYLPYGFDYESEFSTCESIDEKTGNSYALYSDWELLTDEQLNYLKKMPKIWAKNTYNKFLSGQKTLRKMSQCNNIEIRIMSVYALSYMSKCIDKKSINIIRNTAIKSKNKREKSNAIIALGIIAYQNNLKHLIFDIKNIYYTAKNVLVKLSAAFGIMLLGNKKEYPEAYRFLSSINDSIFDSLYDQLPWNCGDLNRYNYKILSLGDNDYTDNCIKSLIHRIPELKGSDSLEVTKSLLNIIYETNNKSLYPGELSPLSITALKTIAQFGNWETTDSNTIVFRNLIQSFGLPGNKKDFISFINNDLLELAT